LRRKAAGASHREVARSLGVSVGVISATLARAQRAGVTAEQLEALADGELEARLYPSEATHARATLPDFAEVHAERQRKGVTLALLHEEYLEANPEGYGYTQFCEYYSRWCRKRRISMRQVHRAGEKLFVDYSGKGPRVFDRKGGAEGREVELFVAVLGASSRTYAEATETQRSEDWIASHTRAVEYFGGVSEVVVPDQLKSGVTRACRYEPGVQRTYAEWAEHYGTTIIPARPRKPRDKAKVEAAVQVAQRWILARLRHERHGSLYELNARIAELREELNARPMRQYGESRRERFEKLDRAALRPLPARRYVFAEWKRARVNIDYHVEIEGHYYSVPHALVHEQVEVRVSPLTVEVLYRNERVASHEKGLGRGSHTTDPRHMPRAHRKHLEWSPSRLIDWAARVGGAHTRALVEDILADRPHPEQGYRSCLGIVRLTKRYGAERVEAACARARAAKARSYRHVADILKRGLDRMDVSDLTVPGVRTPPTSHENVRGAAYYATPTTEESAHADRTDPREAAGAAARRDGEHVGEARGGSAEQRARVR
jgi:transposase